MRFITAATLILVFGALPAAGASASVGVLAQVNAVRATLGEQPLANADSAAQQIIDAAVEQMYSVHGEDFSRTECDFCTALRWHDVDGRDPNDIFHELGGHGDLAITVAPRTTPASPAYAAAALIYDPRATGLALANTPDGDPALAVTFDANRSFTQPLQLVAGPLNPARTYVPILLPSTWTGPTRLTEQRGASTWTTATGTDEPGYGGARYVRFGDVDMYASDLRVAYGKRYTVRAGGNAYSVDTQVLPRSWTGASHFHYTRVSSRNRATITSAIGRASPLYRQLLYSASGMITFTIGGACGPATSCAHWDDQRRTFLVTYTPSIFTRSTGMLQRFVIYHELGHVLDFIGFDPATNALLDRRFHDNPVVRGGCHGPTSPAAACVVPTEMMADQLAWFALAGRLCGCGYGDPPLLGHDAFAQLLRAHWSVRPIAWENALSKPLS